MKKTFGLVLFSCLSLSAISPVVAGAAPAAATTSADPGPVAAEVNGDRIYKADIERMLTAIEAQEPSLQADSPEAQKALGTFRAKLIDDQIERRLLVQEANKRKIQVSKTDVDEGLMEIRGSNVSDADYSKQLAAEGKTPQDVRDFVTDELKVRQLTMQLTSDITLASITDTEALVAYNAHKANFAIPAMAKAHHILLLVKPGTSAEDKAKIYKRAQAIRKEADAKVADFETLARRYSEEPGAKETGGALGPFQREQMVKPFGDAVWSAKIGTIVGPIESEFGYHIILVDERTPATVMPFEKAKDYIKPALVREKIEEKLDQEVQALRSTAVIKKNM